MPSARRGEVRVQGQNSLLCSLWERWPAGRGQKDKDRVPCQQGDEGGGGHEQAFLTEGRGCAKAQGQEYIKTQALQRLCF